MILRTALDATEALEMNREFQSYLTNYGATQKVALEILERLAASEPKQSVDCKIAPGAKSRRAEHLRAGAHAESFQLA